MTLKMTRRMLIAVLLGLLVLAGCGQADDTPATVEQPAVDPSAATGPAVTADATGGEATSPDAASDEAVTLESTTGETADPDAATVPAATPDAPAGEAVEPTYFTPAQQEGPYYPVEKPAERDNDLVAVAGAAGVPGGEILSLAGVVYDASGRPVDGALIEIWQTDSNGVYLHPGDPDTASRDPNFQFYGESVTGPDGVYSFRTILPGRYEPRPRHIHVKVKLDGQELLTTQFYFQGDVDFSGDEVNLVVALAPAEDDAGNPIWVGQRDMVLRMAQ